MNLWKSYLIRLTLNVQQVFIVSSLRGAKFTFIYLYPHAFQLLQQLSRFCTLHFAIFADEVIHFDINSATFFLTPLANVSALSSRETVQRICVALGCKRYDKHRKELVAYPSTWNWQSVIIPTHQKVCLLCYTFFVTIISTFTKLGTVNTASIFSTTLSTFCWWVKSKHFAKNQMFFFV